MNKTFAFTIFAAAVVMAGCNTSKLQSTGQAKPNPVTPITASNAKSLADQQIVKYEALAAKMPDDANTLVTLGQVYAQKGRESGELGWYVKSRETLEKATELDPKNSAAWQSLGHILTVFHRFGKAIECSNKAIELNPNDFRAYGVISDAHLELGDYDKALTAAQKMVDLKPDLGSYSRGAKLRSIFGDTKGAALLYVQAIKAGSPYAENTAWTRTMLGELYFENGALAAAEQQFEAALKAQPKYRHAMMGLGRVRLAQKSEAEAISLMTKACEGTAPVRYLTELGTAIKSQGKASEAEAIFARIEETMGQYESHGIEPDEIHFAMYLLDSGKDVAKAYSILEHEVDHHKTIEAHGAMAWACHKTGRHEEALRHIELALRTNKQDALLWWRASQIYASSGDTKKATKLRIAAESLSPYIVAMAKGTQTIASK